MQTDRKKGSRMAALWVKLVNSPLKLCWAKAYGPFSYIITYQNDLSNELLAKPFEPTWR